MKAFKVVIWVLSEFKRVVAFVTSAFTAVISFLKLVIFSSNGEVSILAMLKSVQANYNLAKALFN